MSPARPVSLPSLRNRDLYEVLIIPPHDSDRSCERILVHIGTGQWLFKPGTDEQVQFGGKAVKVGQNDTCAVMIVCKKEPAAPP